MLRPMRFREEAVRWLEEDPDPDTREELATLLDLGDESGLADRFGERLQFGTAGIRGTLGAGPNRMNRALIRRVTSGLADRLNAVAEGAAARGVVVGRDARHKSDVFADDTAKVLAGSGLAVHRFPDPVPTPLVAFAVRALGAAAGVQVTASHNPPGDNGYKVYGPGGAQILPPFDAEVAAAIDALDSLGDVPLAPDDDALLWTVDPAVVDEYLEAALALVHRPDARDLSIVYTPLHGVAGDLCVELLERAGFNEVRAVPEQADPDPDFPTVAFPNPEMPGALDLALALAGETDADLVLANDPDGDRVAAAVPAPAGGWRPLTGDEVGCLLADHLLAEGDGGAERVVATTVVSSQMLARIAEAHGVGYAETLTGFKWLARAAADAEADGRRMVLAYEQALGVMVGTAVRDKDGLSAALVIAEMAAHYKTQGRTLLDALDDLARRFGVHATAGASVRLEGPEGRALVQAALDRLRTRPPRQVAGIDVVAVADHAAGVSRATDGAITELRTPATDLVAVTLADGTRLQLRPSGTEPLLKFYAEVVEPVGDSDVVAARERAAARLAAVSGAFEALALGVA